MASWSLQKADPRTKLEVQVVYWRITSVKEKEEGIEPAVGMSTDCHTDLTKVSQTQQETLQPGFPIREVLFWVETGKPFPASH